MNTKQKIAALSNMPEIKTAVSLLIAAFKDSELKSHIRITYETQNKERYEIIFLPIINDIDVKAIKC